MLATAMWLLLLRCSPGSAASVHRHPPRFSESILAAISYTTTVFPHGAQPGGSVEWGSLPLLTSDTRWGVVGHPSCLSFLLCKGSDVTHYSIPSRARMRRLPCARSSLSAGGRRTNQGSPRSGGAQLEPSGAPSLRGHPRLLLLNGWVLRFSAAHFKEASVKCRGTGGRGEFRGFEHTTHGKLRSVWVFRTQARAQLRPR